MANAILFDLLSRVHDAIVARKLTGMASSNVVMQKRPALRASDLPSAPFPAVIVAPWGAEDLPPLKGATNRDDITYPIVVAIVANDGHDQTLKFNQYLTWRESIRKLFHAQPLYAADGTTLLSYQIFVRPLDIVDRDAWDKLGNFVSGMILNCESRETRG